MRIQSDGILVVSGAPNFREDHAKLAVKFACDVQALVKFVQSYILNVLLIYFKFSPNI